MLSVNQMFYGTDEPVWLVEGASPVSSVKYHYLGSAPEGVVTPPLMRTRSRDLRYDGRFEPSASSPYHRPSRQARHGSRVARSMPAPPPVGMPYSSINPPPAPVDVPAEAPISHTPLVPVGSAAVSSSTPYTLLLRVPICCEGCERRISKKLHYVPGVTTVRCDLERQRVTVRGTADTDEVLRVAKKAFKRSSLW